MRRGNRGPPGPGSWEPLRASLGRDTAPPRPRSLSRVSSPLPMFEKHHPDEPSTNPMALYPPRQHSHTGTRGRARGDRNVQGRGQASFPRLRPLAHDDRQSSVSVVRGKEQKETGQLPPVVHNHTQ